MNQGLDNLPVSPKKIFDEFMVSVCMVTYNHSKYIERAITSVINQETGFKFELVIGDDRSQDGTREICEALAAAYPVIIKYQYNEMNIGMQRNILQTFQRCKGKYVALLEGDDEWVDKHKLRKQIQVLEENDQVAMCYSNAFINDTRNPASNMYFKGNNRPPVISDHYSLLRHSVVPTCTVVLRNNMGNIPSWFVEARASAYFLFYLFSKQGSIYYIDEPLALYNHHYNGMSRLTSIKDMLYGDSLLHYSLVDHYGNDRRVLKIVIEKNIKALNDLFHLGAFGKALKLFWKQPFIRIISNTPSMTLPFFKAFIKLHFLRFLSKKTNRGVY